MATDNEQLVLSISADTRQIQRQLKSLVGQTQANTKAIEDAFKGIDAASNGAFNRVAANSNKAFTTAAQGAKRYQGAMKDSTVQTSNLAAQLNDIGVQLAGGQSPFLIALQQGSQITQALGAGTGLRGAVAGVAGAFTSLLNPVSLATIAIIALGGEAVQYFTALLSNGEKSEETLQKQAQLIQQVAKEWGDAVPALRDYADELERAKRISELQAVAQIINENTLEDTRASISNAGIAIADLVSQLQSAGEETDVIIRLQNAFNDFTKAANDGSLKVEDVQRVQDALSAAINSTGIPAVDSFREMFEKLSAAALQAAGSVQQVNAQTGAATTALFPSQGAYSGVERSADSQIQGESFSAPEMGPTPERRPLIELEGLPGSGRSSGRRSRDEAAEKAKREKEAVVDLIEQLEFEQGLIGKTDVERAEANALRRAGAAATDEQKAKISGLVEASYAERDAIKANKEAMRELQDISRDVLEGIVYDLRDGKSAADIFTNALGRIADRLTSSAFDAIFSGTGISGGTGKGLFGGAIIPGILHDGGVAGKDGYGHGRAVSPSIFKGAKRYHNGGIAGLRPNEVPAILERGERITPKGTSTAGSVTAPISINIDATGADSEGLARVENQLAKLRSEIPGTVVSTVKDAQKRRII